MSENDISKYWKEASKSLRDDMKKTVKTSAQVKESIFSHQRVIEMLKENPRKHFITLAEMYFGSNKEIQFSREEWFVLSPAFIEAFIVISEVVSLSELPCYACAYMKLCQFFNKSVDTGSLN